MDRETKNVSHTAGVQDCAPASHPWSRRRPNYKNRTWSSSRETVTPFVDEERPRELTAEDADALPFCRLLSGYEPDADRLREEFRR